VCVTKYVKARRKRDTELKEDGSKKEKSEK
jgi:hypothetical protein